MPSKLLDTATGKKVLLLGNEAFARGALEAGIQVVSGYPGTPSSEIIDTLGPLAKEAGIYVEWSTNEKTGFEMAYAAAVAGLRSMATHKSVGLNVAADTFMVANTAGVEGGFVIIVADDPSGHSSQNEQDSRFLGKFAEIPVLEPSDPQECKDAVKYAIEVSEKSKMPVLIRTLTRVSHVRADVALGQLSTEKRKAKLDRDTVYSGFMAIPAHQRIHKRMDIVRAELEALPLNAVEAKGGEKLGIIAPGVGYKYAREAVQMLGAGKDVAILKLCVAYPMPEKLINDFVSKYPRILVIEEGFTYFEDQVKALAYAGAKHPPVDGRLTGNVPMTGELTMEAALAAVSKSLGREYKPAVSAADLVGADALKYPERGLYLCSGCAHMAMYYAMRRAIKGGSKDKSGKNIVVAGDIGCYGIFRFPPYDFFNTHICMGGSIGIANGLAKAGIDEPVFAYLGDSTFFHAGMPSLLNAVLDNARMIVVVQDNFITAMTGHQPSPGTGTNIMGDPMKTVKIEDVAAAFKVPFIRVVDPYDTKATIQAIRDARESGGLALIVARRSCAENARRQLRRKGIQLVPPGVDAEKCTGCKLCVRELHCPSLVWNVETEKVTINQANCAGCGVCVQVCPSEAISGGQGVDRL